MSQVNAGQTKETELFFRQWLRSPKSMGAVIPSSRALARAVSREITWRPGQVIVELGAGTGAISQGLIDSGLPPEALMMIELDRPLFEYLRERFPKVRVINGDATRLVDILRQQGVAEVGTVISRRSPPRSSASTPGWSSWWCATCPRRPSGGSGRAAPRAQFMARPTVAADLPRAVPDPGSRASRRRLRGSG
ncbi:MAG: Phosphatidyl-N-methylethanolamine N-methyltransferase [Geminicoccaceae bacterium]|nr:Phosphatidyl-N-methylethanolamine N-methyltransferase [Geminicoccaceae bacterium]